MEMQANAASESPRVRESGSHPQWHDGLEAAPPVRTHPKRPCKDCRVENAFTIYRSVPLGAAFNVNISFSNWGIPPAGKRAVIETVTATVTVPAGEWARLRTYTGVNGGAGNLDLVLTPQGTVNGKTLLSCTHAVRLYTDTPIDFNVNRDNALTEGHAIVCVSGYLIDI